MWWDAHVDELRQARRGRVGATSARSLLLTVLGEFVLPQPAAVWTSAFVDALAELGVEEKAARQALARTAAEGLISAERSGRRTAWSLTGAGHHLLQDGAERIYGFEQEQHRWDGRWLVVAVTVPETHRQLRHRLRTRLTWAGLGSLLPGIWVTPDATKEGEVRGVMNDLELDAFSWIGPVGAIGDEQRIVGKSWALPEIAERYQGFLAAVGEETVREPADAFPAQVRLVHAWRRFPFLDPALPLDLLPAHWPGRPAADVFRAHHDRWQSDARQHWASLCQAGAART